MRVQLLGTGTPTPSLKRMSSSYLLEVGNDVILFDHGAGAHHRLLESGKKATDVTHLFFSHFHYDHCVDYSRLVLTRWDQGAGKIAELKVYGPPFVKEMTTLLFSREGVFGPDLRARTENEGSIAVYVARGGTPPRPWPAPEVKELRSGDVVKGDGWRVTTTSVIHAQPALVCYGYRLDTQDGSFVYSGDTGPCDAMIKLAKDCDILIHMCHFMSGRALPSFGKAQTGHLELADVARQANVKNLVISHVTEQMDQPGIRERILREMGQIYSGNLIWGEDLMEIPLSEPVPAKLE